MGTTVTREGSADAKGLPEGPGPGFGVTSPPPGVGTTWLGPPALGGEEAAGGGGRRVVMTGLPGLARGAGRGKPGAGGGATSDPGFGAMPGGAGCPATALANLEDSGGGVAGNTGRCTTKDGP